MEGKVALQVDAVRKGLQNDREWSLAARFWYARIRFFIGDDQYFMRIEDGRVAEFKAGTDGFDSYTINIGGPPEVWRHLLMEVPPPYYQDFLPAQLHHGFTCGGDLPSLYAYYGAMSRILAVMRQCHAKTGA
jgi:hypothetical protein